MDFFKEAIERGYGIRGKWEISDDEDDNFFNYEDQLNKFNFIPDFAIFLFRHPYLNINDKQYILDNIVIPYLTDSLYKKENEGKFIIIHEGKFHSISPVTHGNGLPKHVSATLISDHLPRINTGGNVIHLERIVDKKKFQTNMED